MRRDSNRQSAMSLFEGPSPTKTLRLAPGCTLPIPAGALCPQIPSGAVAFRDAPSMPHPRRLRRLGRASRNEEDPAPRGVGLCFVLQAD
jgi:hypothetical protein